MTHHLHVLARNRGSLSGEVRRLSPQNVEQIFNGTAYRDETALWHVVTGKADHGYAIVVDGWVAVNPMHRNEAVGVRGRADQHRRHWRHPSRRSGHEARGAVMGHQPDEPVERRLDPTAPFEIFDSSELIHRKGLAATLVTDDVVIIATKDGIVLRDAQITSCAGSGTTTVFTIRTSGTTLDLPVYEIARIRVPDPRTAEQRLAGTTITDASIRAWRLDRAIGTANGIRNRLDHLIEDLHEAIPSAEFAQVIADVAANLAQQIAALDRMPLSEMAARPRDGEPRWVWFSCRDCWCGEGALAVASAG